MRRIKQDHLESSFVGSGADDYVILDGRVHTGPLMVPPGGRP